MNGPFHPEVSPPDFRPPDGSGPRPPLSPETIRRLDRLCDQFEAAHEAGRAPPLESLLAGIEGEARPRLFLDLLELEVRCRRQAGRPLHPRGGRPALAGLGPWAGEILRDLGLEPPGEPLVLVVIEGPVAGQSYRLTGPASFFVGRGSGVHLPLTGDQHLSRVHFCVEYSPPLARLSDCGSKNGTYLNGRRLDKNEWVDLRDGDQVRAGDLLIRVRLSGDGEGTQPFSDSNSSETSTAPPSELPVIPGYALEEEIGRGGMGVVYRARRGETTMAVKAVLPALAPRFDSQARFRREVGILESLNHPHIVRFHEAGLAGGVVYFVMEYVDGGSASSLVKRSGPMPVGRVVELGCQLLGSLAHAHERGFVHRDVKPGNLLLSGPPGAEVLKLADFGLARAYQASLMSGLTMSGQSGGTPEFMPPEQVRDFRTARPAADQYSAAATLYYLATGEHIYERAPTTMDLLMRILEAEPIPLRPGQSHPALAGPLGEVLGRALRRRPEDRYPDVGVMADALRRVCC